MEKIKIGNQESLHEITNICPISNTVLEIQFFDTVPEMWGNITLYTDGDVEATKLIGYETLFRNEGKTIFLSNDGSIYQEQKEPDIPSLPEKPYTPTEEEILEYLKHTKKAEIASSCEKTIYAGIDVTLSNGDVGHYSLTIEDQLNLFGKLSQISTGSKQLEYHADGQPCRYYTAVDMQIIIQAAMWHVSYHTTYCNAINMWIASTKTVEEIQNIFYGADVPENYQSEVLKTYLLQKMS